MKKNAKPFWESKTLEEMSPQEWESLCDGCALCCLHKLEDEDTGDIYYTRVACRYLDGATCRCSVYTDRLQRVPDCVQITPALARQVEWLPLSCAYRRLAQGEGLAEWHPLISGDRASVLRAGISVKGKYLSEDDIGDASLEPYLVTEQELLAVIDDTGDDRLADEKLMRQQEN